MSIRIFRWSDGLWYATRSGKTAAGPHEESTDVILELERKGFKRFRHRSPPSSWCNGNAGPNKAPQPFKKVMEVLAKVSGVAAVVGTVTGQPAVTAIAGAAGKIADALADLKLGKLKEEVANIDSDDVLDALLVIEGLRKNRDGAKAAIKARKRALKAMR